ncbi:MAG TPA: flavodoxin [Candidatus Tetragenococcus pullicola]|nr:flavodoxin [Candidatus Tetragenococcus pullicola]
MATAKIIYASMTGNTEEIADIVAETMEDLGLDVEIDECTQVASEELQEADICVIATYTYDDGTIPEEIMDLYEDLETMDLSGKLFGVCGSGDTFYDDSYCKAIDKFEKALLNTGAQKGAESIKVDLACDEEDIQKLESFAKQIVEKTH